MSRNVAGHVWAGVAAFVATLATGRSAGTSWEPAVWAAVVAGLSAAGAVAVPARRAR